MTKPYRAREDLVERRCPNVSHLFVFWREESHGQQH